MIKPKRILYLDIETRSRADIKAGVYAYSEDDDFEILMCAYAFGDDRVQVIVGHDNVLTRLRKHLVDHSILKVAHNAQFERVCFSHALDVRYLPAEEWEDTMALAGVWGQPQSLKNLAKALGAEEKDEAGTRLINTFCKPISMGKRKGEWCAPEDKPDEWLDFVDYCRQDVDTLRDIHKRLRPWPTKHERAVWETDQHINDRGINLNVDLARAAVDAAEETTARLREEMQLLTGVDNPASLQQLLPLLQEMGYEYGDLKAESVQEALESDLDPVLRRALEIRQDLALSASKKYATALQCVSRDGRLRGSFRYFGAHTGRWAGRGIQPQNLPRAQLESESDTEAAILDVLMGESVDSYTLKALLRALFTGPFTVVDYAAIEARVLAWLAGETWALEAFAAGRDIYVETAERMSTPTHKLTRSQGKVAVLALGYNGAVGSLRAMGADGQDRDLLRLVTQWRAANENIAAFWAQLEHAFRVGGDVGSHITVEKDGDSRYVWLPSGRPIAYHGVKTRMVHRKGWNEPRELITFADPKRQFPFIDTYGGRLTENVTQAVARDLLAYGLVNLEENGSPAVGHVHDEVIVETRQEPLILGTVRRLFTTTPSWARGLPVDGEGFQCARYRK